MSLSHCCSRRHCKPWQPTADSGGPGGHWWWCLQRRAKRSCPRFSIIAQAACCTLAMNGLLGVCPNDSIGTCTHTLVDARRRWWPGGGSSSALDHEACSSFLCARCR
jgi:hypothetical protein